MKHFGTLVQVVVAAAFSLACAGAAKELKAIREKLPEKITRISEEDLAAKVPSFYYFDYGAEPMPGKRLWLRVSAKKWIERYPSGLQSTFKVLGHAQVGDAPGTIVVKTSGEEDKTDTANNGEFQAFIPDKGNEKMHHLCRSTAGGNTNWTDLGEMKEIE